jgi:hypothetical protein
MSKHTPGPWQVHSHELLAYDLYIVGNLDGPLDNGEMNYTPVCDVADNDDAEGNKVLIAAAPELLDVLRHMVDNFDGDDTDMMKASKLGLFVVKARAAIAKATS